jgi:hypothetical protein
MRIEILGLPGAGKSSLLAISDFVVHQHTLRFRFRNWLDRARPHSGLHIPKSFLEDTKLVSGLDSLQRARLGNATKPGFFHSFNRFLFTYSEIWGTYATSIWDDGYTQRIVGLCCSPDRPYAKQLKDLSNSLLRPDILILMESSPLDALARLQLRGTLPSKLSQLSQSDVVNYLKTFDFLIDNVVQSYSFQGTSIIRLNGSSALADNSRVMIGELKNLAPGLSPVILHC